MMDWKNSTYLRQDPFICIKEDEIAKIEKSLEEWDFQWEIDKATKKGVKVSTYFDEDYPKRLLDIPDPPFALFYKGKLPDEEKLSISIVGARRCTPYGEYYTSEFSKLLAKQGVQIISGLAKGVDGISQRSALDVGGHSYGVIASGVDICYPRDHIGLYQDLISHGGVISEQPLGVTPQRHHFPLRNRIISGLSDIVIVIEAKERSGSLITADMALEQGREVYALPGPINSQLSRGCNRLIKQGAGILISPQDFLEDIGLIVSLNEKISDNKKIVLESLEKLVYSCLDLQAKNIQAIYEETNIPIGELMSTLTSLDLKGYVSEVSKNHYVKVI